MKDDVNSLPHSSMYYSTFALKYRRKAVLQREERGNKENTPATVRMEERKNYRGGGLSGSHSLGCRNTAQAVSIRLPKREKAALCYIRNSRS